MSRLRGIKGVTIEPIWDQIVLPKELKAGDEIYYFFKIGKGEHDPNDPDPTATKSLVETNCPGHGKLSSPEEFEILGVALCPEFGTNPVDIQTIYNKSYMAIKGTGNSVPFRVPTRYVTAGTGLTRTDVATANVGMPVPGAILTFPEEHAIEVYDGDEFSAALVFPKAQTLTDLVRMQLVFWGPHKKGVATT